MTRVGLPKGVGLLAEQADEEVSTAEVPVTEALEPGPDLWRSAPLLFTLERCSG
jgi:hypothetical protein